MKVRSAESQGSLTALENVIPPFEGPPLHSHREEDESWFVIAGNLRFRVDDEVTSAPQGSFVLVPRGTPHCFQNVGDTDARILVLFTPAGMETFFDRFSEVPKEDVSVDTFRDLGREVGMEVLGPPLSVSHPL